jgi:hypothetical protein
MVVVVRDPDILIWLDSIPNKTEKVRQALEMLYQVEYKGKYLTKEHLIYDYKKTKKIIDEVMPKWEKLNKIIKDKKITEAELK